MRNLFERLHLVVSDGVVTEADLPPAFLAPVAVPHGKLSAPQEPDLPPNLTDMEEQAIRRALAAEQGNLTRVAAVLGISRPTLYRKLKTYGIKRSYG
jgi:transcriptional regulator of acetoin/glycerol metabolism